MTTYEKLIKMTEKYKQPFIFRDDNLFFGDDEKPATNEMIVFFGGLEEKEIAEQEKEQKKADFTEWWEEQTLEVNGNVFAIKEKSLIRINLVRSALRDNESVSWQEDWSVFLTNKTELQQVFNQANEIIQAKRLEVFGGVTE